jgi:CDP-diacylglycerol---serine O-phosphatidyltransferase
MIPRPKPESAMFLLPNLFTTGNLFFGCLAIYMVIQQNTYAACLCIIVAAIFDLFDGRLARLTNSTTVFGVEYDSLCDLISFGVAPALLIYHWGFFDFGRLGWTVAFIFIVCGALRLARYNTEAKNVEVEKAYFKGLPIPAAANFFTTMILFFQDLNLTPLPRPLLMVIVVLVSLMMVSPIPFRSFKNFRLFSGNLFTQLVVLVLITVMILIRWETNLFLVACFYLGLNLLIFFWHLARKLFKSRA